MKKFLLLAGMLAAFTACQKDEMSTPEAATTSSFTVTIPQSGVQTRSVAETFGTGTSVNRCILEIYHGDVLYSRIVKPVSDKKVTFDNLRLVASQTYDFVFWADCATQNASATSGEGFEDKVYTTNATGGLKSISEKGEFVGNSDERDAFFAHEQMTVSGAFTKEITLKRPFGLLTVKTNDLAEIKDEALKPTGYTVAFKGLPNTFNALTGEVSGSVDVSYTATELAKADGTISMDFLWASENEAALSDFTMTFYNESTKICTNDAFTNIPIRRNYKTNVSGNLLTKTGTINVTIDPNFNEPDIEKVLAEVASAADVKAALESGATEIIVQTLSNTESNEIVIPQIYATDNDVKISLTLPQTSNPVTIQYESAASGEAGSQDAPANITVTANTTAKTTINTPNSTVTLQGSFGEIDATTADNTLIVPEDVSVTTLNVLKGNVEIYGTVMNITFAEGAGIVTTYAAGDAETLAKAAKLVAESKCAKIVLTANIDLQGSTSNLWTPINTEKTKFTEFDGAGYTLSNLYVDNCTGQSNVAGYYYGGLFYVLQGTVKNLTIDRANVKCFRGAALVGRMDYGTVENCHVKNAEVTSEQKVAGLVGFVNTSSKDVTIRNCSVDQCAMKTLVTEGIFQAGGLVGYVQTFERNVLIEGNSVSGISFDKVYAPAESVADKLYDLEQAYSHAFIGTIANFSTQADAYDKYTVELRNNKVDAQVTGIPTCEGRTDGYIGWWAAQYGATGKAFTPKVVVDGVAKDRWTEVNRVVASLEANGHETIYQTMICPKGPYIAGGTDVKLEVKKGAVFGAADVQLTGKQNTSSINMTDKCAKMTISGEGTITGPNNVTNYASSSAIWAGSLDLTIEGNLTVDGGSGSKVNAAVQVKGGTTTIKGGHFKVGLDKDGNANPCIFVNPIRTAGYKANLKIYGGVFETEESMSNGWYPVINIQDEYRANCKVLIYGGIFVNYDPATGDNSGTEGDTFVAPGYKSVQITYEGKTAWQVVPENAQ